MAEYMNNEVFDWDSTIENDSTFTLLPEGVYPFTVTGFERGHHGGSEKLSACPKAILSIEIDGGSLGKTTLQHNLFIHRKTEGLLCDFFTAIGLRRRGEPIRMDWTRVPGASGTCKVGIREWISSRTGETMRSNEIRRFLEPGGSAAPTGSAGPAGSTGPAAQPAPTEPTAAGSAGPTGSTGPAASRWVPGQY